MKNIFSKLRLLSILLFFFTAFAAYGQKADEYFSEGKELKAKKMYQDAIAKFNSAKSLYNAAKKLSTCTVEIAHIHNIFVESSFYIKNKCNFNGKDKNRIYSQDYNSRWQGDIKTC